MGLPFVMHEATQKILGFEDPWIRYVDPVNGNDNNDGKTESTAWKNLKVAVSRIPKLVKFAVIRLDGVADLGSDYLEIRPVGGSIAIVGVLEEIAQVTGISYTSSGTYTPEGRPELVVQVSDDSLISDALLDYSVESQNTSSKKYLSKIVEYNTDGLDPHQVRLILQNSGTIDTTKPIYLLRNKSKITSSHTSATCIIQGNNGVAFSELVVPATYLSFAMTSVYFSNIDVENSSSSGAALVVAESSNLEIANVGLKVVGSSKALYSWGKIGRSSVVKTAVGQYQSIFNPRSIYFDATYLVIKNGSTGSVGIYKDTLTYLSFVDFSSGDFYMTNCSLETIDFYKKNGVIIINGATLYLGNYNTLGKTIRTDVYGNKKPSIRKSSSSCKTSFRSTPNGTYGRMYLGNCDYHDMGDIDLGDITGYTGSAPLITLDEHSYMQCKNLVVGASGKELKATAVAIACKGSSFLRTTEDVKVYHGDATYHPDVQSIMVYDTSKVMAKNMTITAKTAPSTGKGILQIDNSSEVNLVGAGGGNLTITDDQTATGCSVACSNSKLIVNGSKTITAGGLSGGEVYFNSDVRVGTQPMATTGSARPVKTITNTYTVNDSDYCIVVNSSGAFTISLPTAVGRAGREFEFIRIDSNVGYTITIDPYGTETINGSASYDLSALYDRVRIRSDGANWLVIGE